MECAQSADPPGGAAEEADKPIKVADVPIAPHWMAIEHPLWAELTQGCLKKRLKDASEALGETDGAEGRTMLTTEIAVLKHILKLRRGPVPGLED